MKQRKCERETGRKVTEQVHIRASLLIDLSTTCQRRSKSVCVCVLYHCILRAIHPTKSVYMKGCRFLLDDVSGLRKECTSVSFFPPVFLFLFLFYLPSLFGDSSRALFTYSSILPRLLFLLSFLLQPAEVALHLLDDVFQDRSVIIIY